MRLRKIDKKKKKKILIYDTQSNIGYVIFRRAQMKSVLFTMRISVIHNFQTCSSEIVKFFSFYAILGLHGAFRNRTLRITEKDCTVIGSSLVGLF